MCIKIKRVAAVLLAVSLVLGSTGCQKNKKEPRPTPKATAKVDEGNANASGKGKGQSDVPLIIACKQFSKKFNPFSASSQADKQVVDLTQIKLVKSDRAGKVIYKGINGELRQYGDEQYTYYSATDLVINYDEKTDKTKYTITLRDDLVFSNGEKLTIDDVIFSLYVFCDNDYKGSANLKNMPIQGLLNYQANSSKAEKLSKKKVANYIKKKPAKLRSYIKHNITEQGIEGKEAKRLIDRQARMLLARNTGKKVKKISGIQRTGDYELTITTQGYCKEMSAALQIPICALHYYGDTSKYQYEKNRFGFRRGDISSILANKTAPFGAGAYRFVKLENDVVYFTSNELYYLGCPQIAYLQLKDMTEKLEETRKELLEKTPASEGGEEEINITLAEAMELSEGVVDVIAGDFTKEELMQIALLNSNKKLSGNKVDTRFVDDGRYHYIGIHGGNVSVGKNAGSEASKNLRKALATLFSVSRGVLEETEGEHVQIVNYPMAAESWVSPASDEEGYLVAYSKDVNGNVIFNGSEEAEAKTELAERLALEYLEKAGYQTEDGKVTKAPAGASLHYKVWIADGEENALYPVVMYAKEAMEKLGITLQLQEVKGEALLQKKLKSGLQQIWVGSRPIGDVDLEKRYGAAGKENLFGVSDKKLRKNIAELQNMMSSDNRRSVYRKCFEGILELAVEVPVCEFYNEVLFSTDRISGSTIPQDISPYYTWLNEIQKIEMK